MVRATTLLVAILVSLYASGPALALGGAAAQSVLVLGPADVEETHSRFLADLRDLAPSAVVKPISDPFPDLLDWGEWIYDAVVIVAGPSDGKGSPGGEIDATQLIEFADAGGAVLLAGEGASGARELAGRLGVRLGPSGSGVRDYFSHEEGFGAGVARTTRVARVPRLLPDGAVDGAAYLHRGPALAVPEGSGTARLLVAAEPTALSARAGGEGRAGATAGEDLGLLAAVQSRSGARALVGASGDALADELYARTGSANAQVWRGAVAWALGRAGLLRASPLEVSAAGGDGGAGQAGCRVGDVMEVGLELEELIGGEWRPHDASGLQAELVMLDAHVRVPLKPVAPGVYHASTRAPPTPGAYKWVVDYRRPGLSPIHAVRLSPVRPFAHDEHPRFVPQAAPYYAAVLALAGGFLATGASYLWTE